MKSKAHIFSHPIHPILVSLPIAFYTGTFAFDLIYAFTDQSAFPTTSFYLNIAAIATALLAAIPGLIDYIYVVPPKSTGRKRAAKHGILNVLVLMLFAIALWYRYGLQPNEFILLSIEVVAMILLGIAGWMGGTLVVRNQIGIDIRYARAGKWKEQVITNDMSGKLLVAFANELEVDQMKLVHIDRKRIVLARTETGFVAFDDRCPHRGGSLAAGSMICGTVQCPWHGSQFDVVTGDLKCGPATNSIRTYKIVVNGNQIFLEI